MTRQIVPKLLGAYLFVHIGLSLPPPLAPIG
jgi:hypothetical protein